LNKWYFDEIYEFFIVKPVKSLGRKLWIVGDGKIIDGFGPDGVGKAILVVTRRAVKFQSGYLYHYAFVMLIGLVTLITYLMFLF
jgi:NADH-quinone oxidoreductase subunit L